jgi:hypothetical protein
MWKTLADRFLNLTRERGGPNKSSSGSLTVIFHNTQEVSVTLGTYDILDLPRETYLGPFDSETVALEKTAEAITQMEQDVQNAFLSPDDMKESP